MFEMLNEHSNEPWRARYLNVSKQIEKKLNLANDAEGKKQVRKAVLLECSRIQRKWQNSNRTNKTFLVKNKRWLLSEVQFGKPKKAQGTADIQIKLLLFFFSISYFISSLGGRPVTDFLNSSKRSKRRKVSELRKAGSTPQLALATEMNLRSEGKVTEAGLVKEILHSTPTRASRMSRAWKKSNQTGILRYTTTEALALMLDLDLSRQKYQILRTQTKERGTDLYPSYKRIQEEKKHCYPAALCTVVTESKAEVSLQALLDHTVQRIALIDPGKFEGVSRDVLKNCTLITKWGFDGSGTQSRYHQLQANHDFDDSSLLMTCFVPLQLYSGDKNNKLILWQNPKPSSTRYCRPCKLEYCKESIETIKKEELLICTQISGLLPTCIDTRAGTIQVTHTLSCTMIDGKVSNALTGTKCSQNCSVCSATPKIMNNIDEVLQREENPEALELGLSTLHAYIRIMEWMLHVSYRLDTKKYYRTRDIRAIVDQRKSKIQDRFRKEHGLLLDFVKEGSGTTNTGNAARRFFEKPSVTSEITGIDEELIDRLDTILRTLSCGIDVNHDAYHAFAIKTARLYASLYEWYPMPASAHKILIHGSKAIALALLPIGMMSEEAQEARNKEFRKIRESHSRKSSRKETMQDVFNGMLITSDPFLSSMRTSTTSSSEREMKSAVADLLHFEAESEDDEE